MAALFYKDVLIIATGHFDKAKGLWLPIVDISRGNNSDCGSYVISDPTKSFANKEDAEKFSREIAKAWIDERWKAA
jgi:hypothetical protein